MILHWKEKCFLKMQTKFFNWLLKKKIAAFITATTVTNIYYIARKEKGKNETLGFIKSILEFIDIADVNKSVILNALELGYRDFEDAIQDSSAQNIDISIIITRNEKDFMSSKLNVNNPKTFLNGFIKEKDDKKNNLTS